GINEAGSLCSWLAAGTAYSVHGINMVPFYIFYSMFGFQRVGDFIWAAGDMQARGFLVGATAGRTTLAGEGLQHQDGHSQLLASDYGIPADVLSVTSFSELRREALECERWNLLHPGEEPRTPYIRQMLKGREGPVIAATDYMRTVPDQIRQWVEGRYVTLGTDGFGRSDSRAALRRHFEVDRNYIAVAALKALADESRVDRATVEKAIKALGIDPAKPVPWKV